MRPKRDANGPKYHTGKPCITEGCDNPAGTAWSPYWCAEHNRERLDRISKNLESMVAKFEPAKAQAEVKE